MTYLHGSVKTCFGGGVVDVCLFPRADAAVDLTDEISAEKLENDHPCPWI